MEREVSEQMSIEILGRKRTFELLKSYDGEPMGVNFTVEERSGSKMIATRVDGKRVKFPASMIVQPTD